MNARPWMPLYVADYLANTTHLSAQQRGAYLHLIMHYWQHRGLPTTEDALMRIARLTPAEWRRNRDTLSAFFHDGWRHERVQDEIAIAEARVTAKSRAGVRGAENRWRRHTPANGSNLAGASR